jgi:hypothetical protein
VPSHAGVEPAPAGVLQALPLRSSGFGRGRAMNRAFGKLARGAMLGASCSLLAEKVSPCGTPSMTTNAKNPTSMQVALATLVPQVAWGFSTWAAMAIGDHFGVDVVPFVMVGWCAALLASAGWLNHVLFRGVRTFLPLAAAIVVILVTWLWQRQAFISLVPGSEVLYGYFLRPETATARFWVLTCPFWVGVACLSVCCTAALISGWRAGARRSLAGLGPWWLSAFIVFALPSMNLAVQGNASVFI